MPKGQEYFSLSIRYGRSSMDSIVNKNNKNKIRQDWHIHSTYSCDCNGIDFGINLDTLPIEAEQEGISQFGISDHVHTCKNIPDIINSKSNYDMIISQNPDLKDKFYFGVEVSVMSQWELDKVRSGDYFGDITYGIRKGGPKNEKPAIAIDNHDIKEIGIDYVIGGVHWPLYCDMDVESVIRDYHRQSIFLIEHPDVDIYAHFLWWNIYAYDDLENPFTDFKNVPAYVKNELASALLKNNCAFEINLWAMLMNTEYTENFKHNYLEYIAHLQSMGVTLAIGSDCHELVYSDTDFLFCSDLINKAGIDLGKNSFKILKL